MSTTLFDMTLDEAKAWLRDRLDEGAACPCCGQYAKIYKRRVHSTMARALIAMHLAAEPGEWFYLPDILKGRLNFGGDSTKSVYWGLIEEDDGAVRDDGSSRTGWWRLTDSGQLFVRAKKQIPKYARIYDGHCLGFEGEMVSIVNALGKKFNYHDLMSGSA